MSVAVSGVFCFALLCFAVLPGLWIGDRTSWAREWASVRMAVPTSNPWSPVSRVIQREVAGRRATAGQRERQRDRETRGHTTDTNHIKLHTACTQSKAKQTIHVWMVLESLLVWWKHGIMAKWLYDIMDRLLVLPVRESAADWTRPLVILRCHVMLFLHWSLSIKQIDIHIHNMYVSDE